MTAVVTGDGLTFRVHGTPATKGSLKPVPRGKHIALIESHTTSKPWREAVKWAALQAIVDREGTGAPFATLSGPIVVEVVFTFAKPKSAPKTRRTWPITRKSGDVDKLLRNVFDALADAAVFGDDSQVVATRATKAYVGDPESGLTGPGAEIFLRELVTA